MDDRKGDAGHEKHDEEEPTEAMQDEAGGPAVDGRAVCLGGLTHVRVAPQNGVNGRSGMPVIVRCRASRP